MAVSGCWRPPVGDYTYKVQALDNAKNKSAIPKKKSRARKPYRVTRYAIVPIKSRRNGAYIPSKPIKATRPILDSEIA